MAYYLADFIKIGAFFVPMSLPKVLSKDCILFYGSLCYHNEEVRVAVKTKRGSASKIIRTVGLKSDTSDGRAEALANRRTLRKIHRDAIRDNVNGLRDCVRARTLYTVLFAVCMALMLGCFCYGIAGFFAERSGRFFFLLLFNAFGIYLFYLKRWQIIPYANFRGVKYGTKL